MLIESVKFLSFLLSLYLWAQKGPRRFSPVGYKTTLVAGVPYLTRSQTIQKTSNMDSPLGEFDHSRLPAHIAIIMDGNGRWAKLKGLPRVEGHAQGMQTVRTIVEECSRIGIHQLTLFCFSSENWKRPQPELDFLMQLLECYLVQERPLLLEKNIRFSTIGRKEMLPSSVQHEIDETIRVCRDNTGMGLCLAINYGGRQEIVDAVQKIASLIKDGSISVNSIDESVISSSLNTSGMPDPDLLIRTAGEMRVSNFLLWQISYAEIWVTEKPWPDFDIATLHASLSDYSKRERRFGGLKS